MTDDNGCWCGQFPDCTEMCLRSQRDELAKLRKRVGNRQPPIPCMHVATGWCLECVDHLQLHVERLRQESEQHMQLLRQLDEATFAAAYRCVSCKGAVLPGDQTPAGYLCRNCGPHRDDAEAALKRLPEMQKELDLANLRAADAEAHSAAFYDDLAKAEARANKAEKERDQALTRIDKLEAELALEETRVITAHSRRMLRQLSSEDEASHKTEKL